jgi:hypothetical protein
LVFIRSSSRADYRSIKAAIAASTGFPLFGRIGFTLGIAIMSRKSCRVFGIQSILRSAAT